jgi:hypothetical protein
MFFKITSAKKINLAMVAMSICFAVLISLLLSIFGVKDRLLKEKFNGYPAEILQPVTLERLPSLIDKDTKGIIFVKHGCLNASRDEVEALRNKNGSDKETYIIDGHPVKIELKLCGK